MLPFGRGRKYESRSCISFNPANTVTKCIKRKEMERNGRVLSTWSLKSCPKKCFEALLCRAIQRGQSARAAARHEATTKQMLFSLLFLHFFCACLLVLLHFYLFHSIPMKLFITSGMLCVFHVLKVFTFEFLSLVTFEVRSFSKKSMLACKKIWLCLVMRPFQRQCRC